MTNPSIIINNIDKVQEDMQKMTLAQLVNHEYVAIHLGSYFKKNAAAIINQFKSNYLVLISDPDIKKKLKDCDKFSILVSLLCITKDGLSIHPYDKEATIIPYVKDGVKTAVASPMAKGRIKKMQSQGIINRIEKLVIVYDCDFLEDNNNEWTHKTSFKRTDDNIKIGAFLQVRMADGKILSKFAWKSEIMLRKKCSLFPKMWDEWPDEMWKKTVVIMFEAQIGQKPIFQHVEDQEGESSEPFVYQPAMAPNIVDEEKETETQDADYTIQDDKISATDVEQSESPVEEDERSKNIKELRDLAVTAMTDQERKRMEELLDEMPDKTLKDTLTALQNRIKNMEEKKKAKMEEPAEEEPPI